MLEMYQPAPFAASLRWKEGKVDGSATISGWLSGRGRLVSFACYMGELGADMGEQQQSRDGHFLPHAQRYLEELKALLCGTHTAENNGAFERAG